MEYGESDGSEDNREKPPDPAQERAEGELETFFDQRRDAVFYSRQVEVLHEGTYFHWITNRALQVLEERRVISSERRLLITGGQIKILWHRSFRYYRRAANRLVELVNEYSVPNMGAALGLQGEALVLEGFAREQFLLRDRNSRRFGGRSGISTQHDLDFIFSRDDLDYGIEVKNTLGYMQQAELRAKLQLCAELQVRPVFVARMLPKVWVNEINESGGFALLLGYQVYPWAHKELAERVHRELGLPVDAPRALAKGTVRRFVKWHEAHVNLTDDSPRP